jgi:hypothetical protein
MHTRSNGIRVPAWLRTLGAARIGAAVMALLVGSALAMHARAETKYIINHGVWGGYQEYLNTIGHTKAGAFAITADGGNYYYTWCPSLHCLGGVSWGHSTKSKCEAEYDVDCVVFAVRRDIRLEYEIQ